MMQLVIFSWRTIILAGSCYFNPHGNNIHSIKGFNVPIGVAVASNGSAWVAVADQYSHLLLQCLKILHTSLFYLFYDLITAMLKVNKERTYKL